MTTYDGSQLLSKVLDTIRASTALGAQDVDFCRSMSKDIGDALDKTCDEIVNLINGLLTSVDQNTEPLECGRDRLQDSWKDFSNVMDNIFELSDRSIDILTKSSGTMNNGIQMQFLDDSSRTKFTSSAKIVKPQLSFRTPVDNTEGHPFVPLLKEKPFALKPFAKVKLLPGNDSMPEHYEHPYQDEIESQEYDHSVILKSEPIASQPWDTTEAVWVDNTEVLDAMLSDLKSATELAVDLEHHDYRSYYGIVCLMQISTRSTDYLVDTISLRDDLYVLNEVFANPKILKVFHGAFMDIIWLQRDLGLYVVSLFDTYHASRAIGLPRHSLAYLLERYAHFKTSKKYQLSDWRIRPLSKPMKAYARADTHFLLNIYDQLRNTLIEQNKLAGVLAESRNVAKRRFEYSRFRPTVPSTSVYCPIEKPDQWKTLMVQYNIPPEKEELVKRLYDWRDTIARRDDESSRYVMPNQLLVSLAVNTPTTPVDVISVNNVVTDHVRSNSLVLANLIKSSIQSIKLSKAQSVLQSDKTNNLTADSLLTIPQIKKVMSIFEGIAQTGLTTEEHEKDNGSSKLVDILTSKNNAVDYSDGGPRRIKHEQFESRCHEAWKTMEDFDNTVVYSIQAPEPDAVIKESAQEPPRRSPGISEQAAQPEEDMDEIVTLKRVRRHDQSPETNAEEPKRQAVDYSKSEKILVENRNASKKRDSKKRSFDPYAASNHSGDAPRGVKKRRSTNRGRNVSFKK
ncbi:hypothetical protein HG536_0H04540 [Torulaspora globosa]|uniref:HRDC domain-containing protein n=1 Tax=Torulaspora globosa TaxID=48254 RepID=A0A7G3ZNJ2_9SACH|nr:uncharacterized protein HG536_0H04540 [Torulaspora globosa]QLL35078.1 hypothetical protein HG536_0H04540 [Torulaspora globosa]